MFIVVAPLGFVAIEAGWVVTEVGRQPWIIHQIMRTEDAVTPMPGMKYSFFFYLFLYTVLGLTVTWLMNRQIKSLNQQPNEDGSEENSSQKSYDRERARKNNPINMKNKSKD